MKTLYIDESGTYSSDASKLNPDTPVFLLAGVIIDRKNDYLLLKRFRKLKVKYFQTTNIVFHSREFANPARSKQKGINQFTDSTFRKRFYNDLNSVIAKTDFKIGGFAIHVAEYLKALKANQPDPYVLGVEILLDTLLECLSDKESGKIIAEDRSSSKLNNAVLDRWAMEFDNHNRVGITTVNKLLEHNISKPEFALKNPNIAGLELVDIIGYHFARALALKPVKGAENEVPIELINSKIKKYFSLPTHPHFYLKQNKP